MAEPIKVLVVDDDSVDRMHLRRSLLRSDFSFEVEEAASVAAGIALLGKARFDCAIVDYLLPDGDARDFLDARAIIGKAAEDWPPIVVLTGHGSERIAVDLLKSGAADYLPKSELTPGRIAQCVRHALRVQEISRQRTEAESNLRQSEACCLYLFEQFPEAIVIADSEGRVVEANAPACRLYHKSVEEMKETSIAEIVPSDRPGQVSQDIQRGSVSAGGIPEGMAWVTGKFSVPMQVTTRFTARSGKPALLLHFRRTCESGREHE